MIGNYVRDQSYLRGQLLRESHFNGNDSQNPVKLIQYNYDRVIILPQRIVGLKVGSSYDGDIGDQTAIGASPCVTCGGGCNAGMVYSSRFDYTVLKLYEEAVPWKRLSSKSETVNRVTQTTTYDYDSNTDPRHINVIRASTTNSKGEPRTTYIDYAHEMGNAELIRRNMTRIPLRSKEEIVVNGETKLISGSLVTYGTLNTQFVPVKFEQLVEIVSAVNKYRTLKEITAINGVGRIETFKGVDGVTNSIKWGYNNEFPVVQAVNALAKDVYYESFEESGGTLDSNCKTGSRIRTSAYPVNLTALTQGIYRISYWKRVSGVWSLVFSDVTVSDSTYSTSLAATATEPIDEVRFCPLSSQMTTYTANPLIGVTSVTDPNNVTTYYTYDNFGRLEIISEDNRNIIKNYSYHFKE